MLMTRNHWEEVARYFTHSSRLLDQRRSAEEETGCSEETHWTLGGKNREEEHDMNLKHD